MDWKFQMIQIFVITKTSDNWKLGRATNPVSATVKLHDI